MVPRQERGISAGPVLGVDTTGPVGSVALGRIGTSCGIEILGQTELAGRTYSATLVTAIGKLLEGHGLRLQDVSCIVSVSGPGSFTGVRVGLSAVKGLAEAAGLPVVAVSRLEVLAAMAGVGSAALDAHRSEVFLRIGGAGPGPAELLAGEPELAVIAEPPAEIAICEDAAADTLRRAWPAARLVRVAPPTAADALRLAEPHIRAGEFTDPLTLDGHYLRRSDAEIFGGTIAASSSRK